MLSSIINADGDIEIFFEDEEVQKLDSQTLEGVIFEFCNPDNLYRLYISVDGGPNYRNSNFKIGVTKIESNYYVFVHPEYYKELNEKGWTGTRDRAIKIDLIKESFAKHHKEFSRDLRFIKSRYKNKDKD